MPSRRKTREFVLQVLYAADVQNKDPQQCLVSLHDHFRSNEEDEVKAQQVMTSFARELVERIAQDLDIIDRIIAALSHHWKVSRMTRVDRNILRMAIAEMTGFPDIPGKVTLNEAIDLAKRFGTEHSPSFVNGVLDRIHAVHGDSPGKLHLEEILTRLDETATKD